MTGIVISQAALCAALGRLRATVQSYGANAGAATAALDGLALLEELLAPAPPEMAARIPTAWPDDFGGTRHMPAGPAEGPLPCPITPAAAVAPLATDAPEPAQAAGGTPTTRLRGTTADIAELREAYAVAAGGQIIRAKARLPSGGHRPIAVWTDARKALLSEQFPTCTDTPALLAQLAALPGDPIASLKAMLVQAQKMGLRRTDDTLRIIAQRAGAQGAEVSLERTPAAPSDHMTRERMDLVGRLWMDPAFSVRSIWLQVNALPGAKLAAPTTVYNWARKMGLPTMRPVAPAEPEPELAAAPPPPPEPPAPAAPPNPPIEPIRPGDDKADAFEAFAAGQTVRQVAQDFSLPVDVIVNWHAEWKATQAPQRGEQQTEARA